MDQETSLGGTVRDFPNTQWGLLSRALDSTPEIRRAGLEDLCGRYWKPVYRYLRHAWTMSNEDAKDLTQAFFLWITEKETLARYDAQKASFRTFLKSLLRHFAEHRERALNRLKRGGGVKLFRFDDEGSALRHVTADPRGVDPEQEFDRAWVNALVVRAIDRVRRRFSDEGRNLQLRVFEEYDLSDGTEAPSYEEVAERLGVQKSDVRNYLHAVREQLRREIRAELAETTADEHGLEEEWHALLGF